MALPDTAKIVDQLPPTLRPAFAPLVKRALGVGVGTMAGVLLFVLAIAGLLRSPDDALAVGLLRENYLPGYDASWAGAFLGLVWGFAIGFAAGWLLAFCRNLILTLWVVVVGAKAQLRTNRDFLDQI